MKTILRFLGVILVGTFGLSAFSQQELAVYSVVFEEGALPVTGDPFGVDNQYLAKVSILVTSNTPSGPITTNILTVRGTTIPEQFWFPDQLNLAVSPVTQLASIGGYTNAIRSLQLSMLTNVNNVGSLTNLVKIVNDAYNGRFAILEEGVYQFDSLRKNGASTLSLRRGLWIPTLNTNAFPAYRPFALSVMVHGGAQPGQITFLYQGPTIHPADSPKFFSALPDEARWFNYQSTNLGSVIIFRKDSPRKPGVPKNFRIDN